jgi:hypothetical protein
MSNVATILELPVGDGIEAEVCDVCGSSNVKEIKCKLICQNCGTILKSCSDL